jgi:hypothetical protein
MEVLAESYFCSEGSLSDSGWMMLEVVLDAWKIVMD